MTSSNPQEPSPKERMLAGEHYLADDPEIQADALRSEQFTQQYNETRAGDQKTRDAILREFLGEVGEDVVVRPPIQADYGYRTTIGPRTFINWGLMLCDVATVTIGADVQVGPGVQLLTPTHPTEPEARRAKWEASKPISIGDNVWLGGGVVVCPGVTIGENTVVGAGAVVVRDLPPNVVAVGNPAKVVRKL